MSERRPAAPAAGGTAPTTAVIGLGLIGGSIARDLAAAGGHVLGYDAHVPTLDDARRSGLVAVAPPPMKPGRSDRSASVPDGILDAVAGAEVVVLATPVDVAVDLLRVLAPHLEPARLIMDVGSTKARIVAEAERLGLGPRFVGTHPLAGAERSGWPASGIGLFRGARVYLCPSRSTSPDALALARELWSSFGARPIPLDAAEHDRLLAWTSHLPQLASTALALALAGAGVSPDDLGPGGRGMVRLARSSPDMWAAVVATNGDAIAPALAALRDALDRLDAVLAAGDPAAARAPFAEARRWTRRDPGG